MSSAQKSDKEQETAQFSPSLRVGTILASLNCFISPLTYCQESAPTKFCVHLYTHPNKKKPILRF